MGIPKVAIVGRPNVGKSSLMNWLAGKLLSVVDPTAGVTRDRVTWVMHEHDRYFELVDTGGIGIVDSDDLSADIERQIDIGLNECDLLMLVVDAKAGLTPLDRTVGERVRKINKPTLLVVNKCDSQKLDAEAANYLQLAAGPYVITSVKGNRNRAELLEAIAENLPARAEDEATAGAELIEPPEMRLAIVGRRNVGKSTFINQLAETERVIVSEVAGTTRDSVDIRFTMDGRTFVAIDTPGVRKKKSLANDIEFYGLVRAQKSIRRADVVLMFFDATKTVSRVDKQLVDEIHKYDKPCIFVVNKWDLGLQQEMTIDRWAKYLLNTFASMRHVPIAVLTAKDGRNIRKVINLAQSVSKQAQTRISTGRLNKALKLALSRNPPPHRKNKRPKVYYASQVAVAPPTIVIKCNDPQLFDEAWKRYLLGFLREATPFQEVPIRLILRSRSDKDFDLQDMPDMELQDSDDGTFPGDDFSDDFSDDDLSADDDALGESDGEFFDDEDEF